MAGTYNEIPETGSLNSGGTAKKAPRNYVVLAIGLLVVVGIAVIAVALVESGVIGALEEDYSGDCWTSCCTWEGYKYCPGDPIFQDGATYTPNSAAERVMLRYEFGNTNPEAICNDGTKPAHYYRPAIQGGGNEKNWIIRFEGGQSCFDTNTCDLREEDEYQFLTTAETKIIYEDPQNGGMFNGDPAVNPDYHDWNMISAHYCSSDAWSGTADADDPDNEVGWPFKGHYIVIDTFETALAQWQLDEAERVIVFGFSAGGIGIMSGSESIRAWFNEKVPNVEMFFLMDSSWFLDSMSEWGDMDCTTADDCSLDEQMQKALVNWKPVYSDNCAAAGLTWECMFPEYSFPYMGTRREFFILQNMYDQMQTTLHTATGAGAQDDWFFVEQANRTLQTLLENVDGFYSSNCENHDNLNRNWWREILIDGFYSYEKMKGYYDEVYAAGGKSQTYDEYLDTEAYEECLAGRSTSECEDVPCKSCNPTCPVATEPPHPHWININGTDDCGAREQDC